MAPSLPPDQDAAGPPAVPQTGRRRPPSFAEQQRRKEWGRTWGKVGADYHQRIVREGK